MTHIRFKIRNIAKTTMYTRILVIALAMFVSLMPNSIAQTDEIVDNSDVIITELDETNNVLERIINEYSITSVTVSFATLFIAGATASALLLTIRQNYDIRYVDVLRGTIKDLHNVYDNDEKLQTKNDCEIYATRLLDIMSFLAHLYLTKKIGTNVVIFLKYDFSVAKRIMKWFDDNNLGEKYDANASEMWSNLTRYYNIHSNVNIASDAVMPNALQNFKYLETLVFVYGTLMDNLTRSIILKRQVLTTADTLSGYSIETIEIEREKYSIAIPNPGKNIEGLLIDLTPIEIDILDEYEGDQYDRIKIKLESNKEAWAYVKSNSRSKLSENTTN